jgi:hypothetical protein
MLTEPRYASWLPLRQPFGDTAVTCPGTAVS